jgi:signal transduction histidine kinase/CheY-like chemotaxis protein
MYFASAKHLTRKSIGSRLFLHVLGSALVGLGSMSFFFYQALETRAKDEIRGNLSTQVKLVEGELSNVQQSVVDLSAVVQSMRREGVNDPEAYKKTVFSIFQERTELTQALGFGQTPFQFATDRQWYWPYFFVDQQMPGQTGRQLPAPYQNLRYADLFKDDHYPKQDYYKQPVALKTNYWMEPYQWNGLTLTTYNVPMFDDRRQVIGVSALDVNVTALGKQVKAPVTWGDGYFAVISAKGNLLAYPPDPAKAKALATYQDIPKLKSIWQQIQGKKSGFIQSEGKYWAYERIKGTNWLMLAVVPQSVVLVPVLSITVGGALGAGLILAIVVSLFIRQLNRRLQPILEECNQLAEVNAQRSERLGQEPGAIADENSSAKLSYQNADELDILTDSFHQMATQLKTSFEDLELRVAERTIELKEAKEVADAANSAKSEFLANMSHELRTPLNGILGYAQILKQSQQLSEPEQKGINIIHQCGVHLLTLINDILDLSKIEAQKMELQPTEFHFPSFLEGVVEICQIKAEQKGVEFIYQLDRSLPAGIKADEKRLRQILMNLLSNAIKFTEKGSVTFSVKNQITDEAQSDQGTIYRICFRVEDTGVGISQENLGKIFSPFEQVGNVQKQSEGTGLGLAISQKITEMMGGSLNVKSRPDKGSIFWFEIDILESEEWSEVSKKNTDNRIIGIEGRQQKILVVDDRWENRSVIVNLLEPIGFEVIEAQDGQEGLDKTFEFEPDLIISDLAMSMMDGHEMIRQLRQIPQFQKTAVIVSSASVFEIDRQKSLDAGANDFLPKPLQSEHLLNSLQQLLELKWIYETKIEETTSQEAAALIIKCSGLVLPSEADLYLLYDLSRKGLVHNLSQELDRIEQQNPQLKDFTQEVRLLIKSFQLKKIRNFLEQYLDRIEPIEEANSVMHCMLLKPSLSGATLK